MYTILILEMPRHRQTLYLIKHGQRSEISWDNFLELNQDFHIPNFFSFGAVRELLSERPIPRVRDGGKILEVEPHQEFPCVEFHGNRLLEIVKKLLRV